MRLVLNVVACVILAGVAGCSTERGSAGVAHEQMVAAACRAISQEAYVYPETIERCERDTPEGRVTTLKAPYVEYSHVTVDIDSRNKCAPGPELKVNIITNEIVFVRHRDWEWRLQELVEAQLKARTHGPESAPTSLSPAPLPVFGEEATPLRSLLQ